MADVREVPLELIDDNQFQDREIYQDIEDLGRTIAVHGLKEYPKAREIKGRFELQFGHRRKRAFAWLKSHWQKEGLPNRYNGYTVMPLIVEERTDREMFNSVVIENVHRDDLKTTEKARLLKRYREQFPEATSEEVGLVFGMKAPTVRGMDLFLDLPKPVQQTLAAGEISQDTARKFHSLQKIAPEKFIVETLKKVEKEKGNRLPEAVIEDAIERLDNVVDMWNENNRDGKPRSRYSNGWLLDMRNFPNQLLPALTPVDAALALGTQGNEKARKLVEEYLEHFQINFVTEPDQAQLEKLEADKQKALDRVSKLNPDYSSRLQHLIDPPACTACPFYTKVSGSHFCGMNICHSRKSVAWNTTMMEQASKKLGIAIYSQDDGKFQFLDSYDHRSLFNSKDKGLRLILTSGNGSRPYQHFPEVESDVFAVAATGDAIGKMAKKSKGGGGGKLTEKEKAERRAMRVFRQRRRELLWEYTAAAQSLFEGVPIEVLRKVCGWHFIGIDDRIPDEHDHPQTGTPAEKLEFQRRELIWKLVVGETSHYTRSDLVVLLERFQKITQVKTPKALLKRVQQWDEEIHDLARVSAETPKQKKGKKA